VIRTTGLVCLKAKGVNWAAGGGNLTEPTMRDLAGRLIDSFLTHPYLDRFRFTRAKVNYWKRFRPLRYASLRWINLGSGSTIRPGMCNIDVVGPADLHFNFLNHFPLDDGITEAVYCEHVLEHFRIDQVPHILREVCRILAPRGVFRISVPRIDTTEKERESEGRPRVWRLDDLDASAMMALNRGLFGHEHHAVYSHSLLESILKSAGFSEVQAVQEGQTAWFPPALLRIVEHRKAGNLVVEALK